MPDTPIFGPQLSRRGNERVHDADAMRDVSAGMTEAEARANFEEAICLYRTPSPLNLPEQAKSIEVRIG